MHISTTRRQYGCSFSSLNDLSTTDRWIYTIWRSHANSRWSAVNKVWGREPQKKTVLLHQLPRACQKNKVWPLIRLGKFRLPPWNLHWRLQIKLLLFQSEDNQVLRPSELCNLAKHNVLLLRTHTDVHPNYIANIISFREWIDFCVLKLSCLLFTPWLEKCYFFCKTLSINLIHSLHLGSKQTQIHYNKQI